MIDATHTCISEKNGPGKNRLLRTGAGLLCLLIGSIFWVIRAQALVIEYPASAPGTFLRLVLTNAPGGLAKDLAGNLYYSDQGDGGLLSGRILMIPAGSDIPITIVSALNKPGDIELTPDGRGLIITEDGGKVTRRYFGFSASIKTSGGETIYGLTLYIKRAGLGITKGYRIMENTYYTVPDLLVPELTNPEAELTIEYPSGKTLHYPIRLGQEGFSELFGQTLKNFIIRD
jgi:hypothetical protein